MRLTLLGTGNAAGVPVFGCQCDSCSIARESREYSRKPCSALLEVNDKRYLIDAGLMDLADRFSIAGIDGIFITHFHPDHVQGLFHLRWGKGKKIPVYCPPDSVGCADLFKHPGLLDFQVQEAFHPFSLEALKITPLPLIHSKPTFGYLFETTSCENKDKAAYLVDTKGLPDTVIEHLTEQNVQSIILDTSSPPGTENRNHNTLDDTLFLHQQLGTAEIVMTHIGHELDLWLKNNATNLPEGLFTGHDNYCVTLK